MGKENRTNFYTHTISASVTERENRGTSVEETASRISLSSGVRFVAEHPKARSRPSSSVLFFAVTKRLELFSFRGLNRIDPPRPCRSAPLCRKPFHPKAGLARRSRGARWLA